ncbi:MAG: SDR family oxidoreductase [Candidatus Heimdallarchaeota archaeon]|nr:MAG: SDR family oxidoreductase [Candidatus Heimdallarchaeota archaeon]
MTHVKQLFDLSGKKALVTGGASGIGYTMAEGLAEAGAAVAICGRGRHGSLEEASSSLEKIGSEIIAIKCDVSVEDDILELVKTLDDQNFPIDTLVNNAGVSWGHDSETMPLDRWNMVIETNLTGLFVVTREVAKKFMIPKGSGSIINIASVSGLTGGEIGIAAYSASKAGVIGITKQLAIEWASLGIRVNAIAPSWFPSYMTRHFTGEDSPYREVLLADCPFGRFGESWELKGPIVFLSSRASSYITGTVIPVDGGYLAK